MGGLGTLWGQKSNYWCLETRDTTVLTPLELLGSFPFSFQFITRLAAVFAEEVGGFILCGFNRTYTTLIFYGQI